jgi:hypothetical protein
MDLQCAVAGALESRFRSDPHPPDRGIGRAAKILDAFDWLSCMLCLKLRARGLVIGALIMLSEILSKTREAVLGWLRGEGIP